MLLKTDKEKFGRWYRQRIVEELAEKFSRSPYIFLTEFQRLKVNHLEELRRNLHKHSALFMVVKNSLAQLALRKNQKEGLIQLLSGQTGMVLGGDDPITISKVLVDYSKNFPEFKIKGGLLNTQIISSERIRELSQLPPPHILLGKLSGYLRGIFLRLVQGLNLPTKFYLILKGMEKKKKEG
ncbi:MAG: 50S ribosomal protein L10 [Candidatus Omnitrophica bacterium]|nr:50S ribosomal protein L10 [Candidatus Omnitrophota bacterium]MCM8799013.1 50S ribosomal protein L10 [Candidatus Omnitrophota bacterium]